VGRQGLVTLAVAGVLGLLIALVAITMEEMGLWSERGSLLWFAFAFPVAIAVYQYWCWKWVRFKEKVHAV
jgi:hypothetical protein